MRVALTFDLRSDYLGQGLNDEQLAEFDGEDTILAIEDALQRQGHSSMRVGNLHALLPRLSAGERWDLVFNIAEGRHGIAREAQIPALLDAFQLPYTFSEPLVLALALDKAMCKRVVANLGVATPPFCTVHGLADLAQVNLPWPVFAKPLAGGTSAGISGASIAQDAGALRAVCTDLLARFAQPVLVEAYLPGREFTVGMAGSGAAARVLGVMEILLRPGAEPGLYSFANKRAYTERVSYRLLDDGDLAQTLHAQALRVWTGLNCRDAGRIDFRCDAGGQPQFLEINPLAGLHPVDSDLVILCRLAGIGHAELIGMIMASAQLRLNATERQGVA